MAPFARSLFDAIYPVITDSLVSIGTVMKGATVYARWVPSGRNWAGGPSRGRSIQAEAKHRAPLVRYDPLQDQAVADDRGIMIDGHRVQL